MLQKLRNRSSVTLEASAREKAAQILAEGEQEAVNIKELTRNQILKQKVEILAKAGKTGEAVLFIQQQLPRLFESFKAHAEGMNVDSLVIMDNERGFNGAVNRGPTALSTSYVSSKTPSVSI